MMPNTLLPLSLILAESFAIFTRIYESFDHFRRQVIAVELIQLGQPEVKACVVAVRRIVRIASQITEVLHQHKSAIRLSADQVRMFGDGAQYLRPRLRTC